MRIVVWTLILLSLSILSIAAPQLARDAAAAWLGVPGD
jgi:hypothetical protein